MEDTCVMCGEYVPEGRQVCTNCEKTSIKDSGHRRQFDSGAVRDIQEGKGRCDLLPLGVVADLMGSKELMRIHEFKNTGDVIPLFDALKEFSLIYMTRDEEGQVMMGTDEVKGEEVHFEHAADVLLKGHGDKSIMLLSQFITLTEEEILCIRYHMGAYVRDDWEGYDRAIKKHPNVLFTHTADMYASKVLGY